MSAVTAIPPLRVLQICSSLAWGGTEMLLPIIASKLQERGHDVLAVCHPDGKIRQEAAARGIPTETIPLGGYLNPVTTRRLIRLFRRERPDMLHLHLSRDLWQVVPAARWSGCGRVVLTKHVGSYIKKHDPLHRWLYRHVDRVIAVSDVLRRNVIETCPISSERVVTIHNGLDLSVYDASQYQPETIRKAFDIHQKTRIIGTVGRITPGKGYEEFLQAARRIRDQAAHAGEMPVKFLIVGDVSYGEEPYREKIVSMTRQFGLENEVVFAGFRRDIPALLRAMDVFVFPSRAEGLGIALLEAMAMRVPCVSTCSDGTVDIVEDGVSVLAFASGDADALADAVLQVLRDAALGRRLAGAARRRIEEKFDLETMISRIEAVYAECLRAEDTA